MMVEATTQPRAQVGTGQWDAYVEAHPRGWFWHRAAWIDYCLAYHPGATDLSFAVVNERDGSLAAVVPMVLEGDRVAMGGSPCAGPLTPWNGSVTALVTHEVGRLAVLHGASRVAFRLHPLPEPDVPSAPPAHWRVVSWPTHVVDLGPATRDLWRAVRGSYHSLVRRAEREREVLVTCQPWALDVCHALHARAAGRETRPAETWEHMRRWLEAGDAVVALVSHRRDGAPVTEELPVAQWTGFAYALRWKRWAYYASGATLERDTAHVLQWHLIDALRCWGAAHYELGWGERPGDTEKDRGVSMFKSGWGGQLWTVPACERSY